MLKVNPATSGPIASELSILHLSLNVFYACIINLEEEGNCSTFRALTKMEELQDAAAAL